MSYTSDLLSVGILSMSKNKWVDGDSNASMSLIVRDAQALATGLDNLIAGTITITQVDLADGTVSAPSLDFANDPDTGLYRIGANNMGVAANGAKVLDISTSGLGITGAVDVSTNITFTKEVNHTVSVSASTTANTAGANLTVAAANGVGSGIGGVLSLSGGIPGATGSGGEVSITSAAGGATSGDSGNVDISTGTATVGGTGDITLTTGNTASGVAGDVIITTGTHTSATVEPVISMVNGVVGKPKSATVASGGTITGPNLVGGLITATGATGNWQLPTAAQITTAIGATPAGTNFEFVFNAAAMTATNTATLVVGTNMSVASAPAITGGGTLTVTQDTQVTAGFKIVYNTATTCKIYRIW